MSLFSRILRAPNPPYEPPETRNWSISDPQLVSLFGGTPSIAGVTVSERSALGLSAVWRCVNLIAGSIASLPLRTIRTNADGTTQRARSWLDDPAGSDGVTSFEWVEYLLVSMLLHGNAYFYKITGGVGQILGLQPLPPLRVGVEVKNGRKLYRVSLENGQTVQYTDREILHIPGITLDGYTGISPITIAKNSLGAAIGQERSAARLFSSGLLASAIITPDDDLSPEEAGEIATGLERTMSGEAHAGEIHVINRRMKITPWTIEPEKAEFLSSRSFSIDEVSRWFGIPPHLLGQTEKQTSFGAGLTEQNRGLARYTFIPWTSRIEQRLSRLLADGLDAEFDYSMLIKPSTEDEIDLLVKQVDSGILTVNEARRIRNMPELPGGDVLRVSGTGPEQPPQQEPTNEA